MHCTWSLEKACNATQWDLQQGNLDFLKNPRGFCKQSSNIQEPESTAMLTYEKGNPSFKASEMMREYLSQYVGHSNEWNQDYYSHKPAKSTHKLLNSYPTCIHQKAQHTSILKHITHYPFCKLFNLWSSREYTSFPSEILMCTPSKRLSLISFSCIDNTVCLASTFCMTASTKYQNPALRTSHLSSCPIQILQAKIYRQLSCNYYSGTCACCSGVLLIEYK